MYAESFPNEEIDASNHIPLFYYLFVRFYNKLQQIAETHNETYIQNLINKHKQIIELFNNNSKEYWATVNKRIETVGKSFKFIFKFVWYAWILVLVVSTIRDRVKGIESNIIADVIAIFLLGVLPGLIIIGISKKIANKTKKN